MPYINFKPHCLINNLYIPKKVINLYIPYTLGPQLRNLNTDFTLGNCLFGSVKLTKNSDLDNYKYSAYGIDLILVQNFHCLSVPWEKMSLFFEADMSSSVKDLGEGPTYALDDTTLTEEAKYPNNFIQSGKRFVLSLHYNGNNSFSFVNATKLYQFKAKNSEIKVYSPCLGNISNDFTINNMKKQD